MRWLLCLLLVGGCFGRLDANLRPAVIPRMTELPGDPEKRDAVLAQANTTAGPETRKGLTKTQRRIETSAAFAAAFLGMWFSKSGNIMLGTATTFDENRLFEKPAQRRKGEGKGEGEGEDGEGSGSAASPALIDGDPGQLVPWVKLSP